MVLFTSITNTVSQFCGWNKTVRTKALE